MKPLFSIIIPCCNVEPYVEECLQSVLDQPFQDWECLAVVETSRDRTEQIVRTFAEKDPRIRVFTQPKSGSPSAPRNTGLDHAGGKYVLFVDGDDYITENSLGRIAAKMSAHPEADLYPCSIIVHDTKNGKETIWENYPENTPAEMTGQESIVKFLRYHHNPCPMAQLTICRRDFLNENGLRFVYGLKHEDNEFSPRALQLAERVVPLHEPFYFYRVVPNSITNSKQRPGYELKHIARVKRNLLAFHAEASRKPGFDPRVSEYWADLWLSKIFGRWFYPWVIDHTPRRIRIGTLRFMLADEMDSFLLLVKSAPFTKKLMSRVLLLAVRHPSSCAWFSESLFRVFFSLSEIRNGRKEKPDRTAFSSDASTAPPQSA